MQIIIALDNMDFDKAFGMFVELAPHCDGFKINHTLLEHSSMFTNYEGEVMVDLGSGGGIDCFLVDRRRDPV